MSLPSPSLHDQATTIGSPTATVCRVRLTWTTRPDVWSRGGFIVGSTTGVTDRSVAVRAAGCCAGRCTAIATPTTANTAAAVATTGNIGNRRRGTAGSSSLSDGATAAV